MNLSFLSFYDKLKEIKDKKRSKYYMVLINCSGKNSYGGVVSSKYNIIVDKDNTDKVQGTYRISSDNLKAIVGMYSLLGESDKIKFNEFDKIETEGMSTIEKFIFED